MEGRRGDMKGVMQKRRNDIKVIIKLNVCLKKGSETRYPVHC